MSGTPIEQLHLSTKGSNVLRKMNIHTVEELLDTPIDLIAQQKFVGIKTVDEIKFAIEEAGSVLKQESHVSYSEEQLTEMSRHSITELDLSVRPYNVLRRAGCITIDKVAKLSEPDFEKMYGLGKISIDEIKCSLTKWILENFIVGKNSSSDPVDSGVTNTPDTDSELYADIDSGLKLPIQHVASVLAPVLNLNWKQLYDYCMEQQLLEKIRSSSDHDVINIMLGLSEVQRNIGDFWKKVSINGVISISSVSEYLDSQGSALDVATLIYSSVQNRVLLPYRGLFLIARETFKEVIDKEYAPSDKVTQIFLLRTKGETLQDIGQKYGVTRERIRQILVKTVRKYKIHLLFEDYFREPYQYFHFQKSEFMRAFPGVTDLGYEYLSIRYSKGKAVLNESTLAKYKGFWKDRLNEFLHEEKDRDDKQSVTKSEMVMRVLISNADTPLSIKEFEHEYYKYLEKKGFPIDRLSINIRTIANHLRNAKGIVFNRENKVRYCDADPNMIWKSVDFDRYKNTVISSELIFRDYPEIMEELDIRDGYELFYVIKTSLKELGTKRFPLLPINCRRVPVIVMGKASEKAQAIKLLKEISPVACSDYYEAYEERYGVRKDTARGNPTIANAVNAYLLNGQFVVDAPTIDERDVDLFRNALSQKSLWFIEDIEDQFRKICVHTSSDALNAFAFRQIGYNLHAAYAYKASYGTVNNFFDKTFFCQDVINLNSIDRHLHRIPMFYTLLDKKKKSLEYIETDPQVLVSIDKIVNDYGISIDEIRDMQSWLSNYYKMPYFNGRSIWHEVKEYPAIRKLQGNDWLLTCIMRQQENIASMSVAGAIILSLDSTSLSLSQICEWLSSVYGAMPINKLTLKFNEMFGARILSSKLAEKLRTSGLWDKVVTDSMDEFIENLVDAGLSNMNPDDLFKEEF